MTQSLILKLLLGHAEVHGKTYIEYLESLDGGALIKRFMAYL
jgi:hypothetical protein